ncbi:hypothetical protein IJI28_03055 [Candidatus Saccharibacteria bacterium]|nr:hypothetical protein [Candidatus Saccharibacteria bacterium]
MEFVRLKYANNKLIDSDIREHREIINDYVTKKGFDYLGYIPILFAPNGKPMEVDLIFKKRVERPMRPIQFATNVSKPTPIAPKPAKPVEEPKPATPDVPKKPEIVDNKPKKRPSNFDDLYNDHDLDLILNGGGDDLLGEGK